MKNFTLLLFAATIFANCNKKADAIIENGTSSFPGTLNQYTIQKGQHYCDKNDYKAVETSEMKFVVKFDSSAIYQTLSAENQYDINKLFGFSDNNKPHHEFSARIGWRWSDNALRLFAYVYNESGVATKELAAIAIGAEAVCSIKIDKGQYLFTVNNVSQHLPRLSTTAKAKGYQLYPYFGGDEVAPHQINILMKYVE